MNATYRKTRTTVTFADVRVPATESHPFGKDSLFEVDLLDGDIDELLRLDADVRGFDWSPNGRYLAYQLPSASSGRMTLNLFDSRIGTAERIRNLEQIRGTSTSQSEEQSVSWSPDGSSILVVDTHEDPSLRVLDHRGRDQVEPRAGTFARWLDSKTVLFRELGDRAGSGRWFTLDVRSDKATRVEIPRHRFRPAVSPDGTRVAYDDGNRDGPYLFAFDLRSGKETLVVRGYGAPIWLGYNVLAATAGGPCPPRTECRDWWQPQGEVLRIDLISGDSWDLDLPSTLHETCLFSTISVLQPTR